MASTLGNTYKEAFDIHMLDLEKRTHLYSLSCATVFLCSKSYLSYFFLYITEKHARINKKVCKASNHNRNE